jgi:hypothetical protein
MANAIPRGDERPGFHPSLFRIRQFVALENQLSWVQQDTTIPAKYR